MKKFLALLKKYPLLNMILTVAVCYLGIQFFDRACDNLAQCALLRVILAVVCGASIFAISGSKSFEKLDKDIGYVQLKYIGFLIFGVIVGLVGFVPALKGGVKLVDKWPLELFFDILLVVSVGIYEELCFRVIINDALLYQFRNNKYIFVWIAIISSLIFGLVHIIGASIETPIALTQAILKTLTSALMGFGLLILYWKTHNFWAIAISHAIYDSLPLIAGQIFDTGASVGSYISEETIVSDGFTFNKGYFLIGLYAIQLIIHIVLVLGLLKVLKSIDFKKIRQEW
ncbi:CAAX prenyl protease-like protein [Ruminococcaceae bacterium R-25]|nr:CAAX prenyl protease-like protein [Ruminococcaceae bacterium R-25]SUQ21414.1 CAAX protease self-immunity [Oscillospiraceae bacterium]